MNLIIIFIFHSRRGCSWTIPVLLLYIVLFLLFSVIDNDCRLRRGDKIPKYSLRPEHTIFRGPGWVWPPTHPASVPLIIIDVIDLSLFMIEDR